MACVKEELINIETDDSDDFDKKKVTECLGPAAAATSVDRPHVTPLDENVLFCSKAIPCLDCDSCRSILDEFFSNQSIGTEVCSSSPKLDGEDPSKPIILSDSPETSDDELSSDDEMDQSVECPRCDNFFEDGNHLREHVYKCRGDRYAARIKEWKKLQKLKKEEKILEQKVMSAETATTPIPMDAPKLPAVNSETASPSSVLSTGYAWDSISTLLMKKPIECRNCKLLFHSEAQKKAHKDYFCAAKKYSCQKCCLRFSAIEWLSRHVAKDDCKVKNYSCTNCHIRYAKERYLVDHQKMCLKPYDLGSKCFTPPGIPALGPFSPLPDTECSSYYQQQIIEHEQRLAGRHYRLMQEIYHYQSSMYGHVAPPHSHFPFNQPTSEKKILSFPYANLEQGPCYNYFPFSKPSFEEHTLPPSISHFTNNDTNR